MFSPTEKERRHGPVRQVIKDDDLKAILLIGDAGNGSGFSGDYRYYTNNRTITYREVIVVFPHSEAVLFTTTTRKLPEIERRSFVSDCRFSDDLLDDTIKLLIKHGISSGRIGVSFEMLSVAWHRRLMESFPSVEWVEVHEKMMQIRFNHSDEEANICRKGASLADGSYEAALAAIRPGASEFEIVAAIEGFSRPRGAEEHFSLIGSGKYSFRNGTNLIFYYPTHRRLEVGDSVLMEITPRYEGYWTQVVRAVNVGAPNPDLENIQRVCRGAIKAGLEQFGPGKKVRDVVLAMEPYVANCGYVLKAPFGHISGIDLVEARVSPKNEMVLTPGTSVTIHPTVFTRDDKNWSFCGETYLVTQDGYERLNRAADDLITV
ncbi:MAG TPA: M24 family metallopeptidase [Syntrophorhabdales bacterium]|nr:M24 family metallopeptidase [Syntrophorhabdales bacterium]